MVKNFRAEIADELESINLETGKTEYELLGNGYYAEFNRSVSPVVGDKYSLKSLKRELLSNSPVDHVYIQLISDRLDIDIYLINSTTEDIYTTGSEIKTLYKGRNSIVILYTPGHYDLIGIQRESSDEFIIDCLFDPSHKSCKCLHD